MTSPADWTRDGHYPKLDQILSPRNWIQSVLSASGSQRTKDTCLEEARISSLLPNACGCGKRKKKKSPAMQKCRVQDFGYIKTEGGRGLGLFSSSRLQLYIDVVNALPIPALPWEGSLNFNHKLNFHNHFLQGSTLNTPAPYTTFQLVSSKSFFRSQLKYHFCQDIFRDYSKPP